MESPRNVMAARATAQYGSCGSMRAPKFSESCTDFKEHGPQARPDISLLCRPLAASGAPCLALLGEGTRDWQHCAPQLQLILHHTRPSCLAQVVLAPVGCIWAHMLAEHWLTHRVKAQCDMT